MPCRYVSTYPSRIPVCCPNYFDCFPFRYCFDYTTAPDLHHLSQFGSSLKRTKFFVFYSLCSSGFYFLATPLIYSGYSHLLHHTCCSLCYKISLSFQITDMINKLLKSIYSHFCNSFYSMTFILLSLY